MTMTVAVIMIVAVAMAMAVTAKAALRFGHACQHARARPLRHANNDQLEAPA
jgi:hypothetical protein